MREGERGTGRVVGGKVERKGERGVGKVKERLVKRKRDRLGGMWFINRRMWIINRMC